MQPGGATAWTESNAYPEFAAEVREGLLDRAQKRLPCQYFYDAIGSILFEAICLLPEYGLTRADERLIRGHAAEAVAMLPSPAMVVELGSGSGTKTRYILEALARREHPVYYPVDVSASALELCRQALCDVAAVNPVHASYVDGLKLAAARRHPNQSLLILFLGSTIGNFERPKAARFLAEVRSHLRAGDMLLLGTDLEKPEHDMLLAYDDPTGVTAAFNLNLLTRINRELGGNFVHRKYAHQAVYNREQRRIEMHLRSRVAQRVSVPGAGVEIELRAGETIWTESSHKFKAEEICEMAACSGFGCTEQWIDSEWPFAESCLVASDGQSIPRECALTQGTGK